MSTLAKFTPATNEELERIDRETAEADSTEPRLSAVAYDAPSKLLRLTFKSGASLNVPLHLLNGFENATPEQIGATKIVSNGAALHWDELDVQATTIAIVQRVFKIKSVVENARLAGQTRSAAKSRASRENGRKGGRPRKQASLAAQKESG